MYQKYDGIANEKVFLKFDIRRDFEISFVNSTFSQIEDDANNQYLSICEIHDCYKSSEEDADPANLDSNRKKVKEFIEAEYLKSFKHNEIALQGVKEINFALMNELFVKAICEHTYINLKHTYYPSEDFFGNITCESANTFDFFELAVGYVKMQPSVLFLKSINTYSDTEEGVRDFLKDAKSYDLASRARELIGPNKVNIFHPEQIDVEEDNYDLTKLGPSHLDGIKYKKKLHYGGSSYLLSVEICSPTRTVIQTDEEYARLVSDINRNTENDLDRYNEENDLSHPLDFLEHSIMHTEFLEFPDF